MKQIEYYIETLAPIIFAERNNDSTLYNTKKYVSGSIFRGMLAGKFIKDSGATIASLQYTLPQATTETLGGVKASTLVTVTEGVLGLSDTVLLSTDEFIINGGTSAVE